MSRALVDNRSDDNGRGVASYSVMGNKRVRADMRRRLFDLQLLPRTPRVEDDMSARLEQCCDSK